MPGIGLPGGSNAAVRESAASRSWRGSAKRMCGKAVAPRSFAFGLVTRASRTRRTGGNENESSEGHSLTRASVPPMTAGLESTLAADESSIWRWSCHQRWIGEAACSAGALHQCLLGLRRAQRVGIGARDLRNQVACDLLRGACAALRLDAEVGANRARIASRKHWVRLSAQVCSRHGRRSSMLRCAQRLEFVTVEHPRSPPNVPPFGASGRSRARRVHRLCGLGHQSIRTLCAL